MAALVSAFYLDFALVFSGEDACLSGHDIDSTAMDAPFFSHHTRPASVRLVCLVAVRQVVTSLSCSRVHITAAPSLPRDLVMERLDFFIGHIVHTGVADCTCSHSVFDLKSMLCSQIFNIDTLLAFALLIDAHAPQSLTNPHIMSCAVVSLTLLTEFLEPLLS